MYALSDGIPIDDPSLVLGSGQRLFEHDDHVAKLQLSGSTATTTEVILATYQPI